MPAGERSGLLLCLLLSAAIVTIRTMQQQRYLSGRNNGKQLYSTLELNSALQRQNCLPFSRLQNLQQIVAAIRNGRWSWALIAGQIVLLLSCSSAFASLDTGLCSAQLLKEPNTKRFKRTLIYYDTDTQYAICL